MIDERHRTLIRRAGEAACVWSISTDRYCVLLAAPPDVLSPRMVGVIEGEITPLAHQDAGCKRLVSVPGIGPIISAPWWPRSAPAMPSQKVATSPPG